MNVIVKDEQNCNVIYVEGRVETTNSGKFEEMVSAYFEDSKPIVFDLKELTYISSSGLRVLLLSHKVMLSKGESLILRNVSKEIYSILSMTGFAKILTIV